MQVILFTGIPGAGKSSFFRARFFDTHVRVNLDMLRTRHRERVLFRACLEAKQSVVIDNTNLTVAERAPYIEAARAADFSVTGYYFRSVLAECLPRNAGRPAAQIVPERGVLGAAGRLEIPSLDEGFDELFYVRLEDSFIVSPWAPLT